MNQKTIGSEVSLEGIGLHTGNKVSLTFKPAAVNSGFTFIRTDLEGQPAIEAL
ncbi:UDP-3-O-acyl-N-acetylglucosamine deacetylase, partial [Lutimonas sp.]|uniref:UDP-3-O-acyl-N-acetylglucosamine deacetylase n=1 Tax=Lutimonas sp. TaxID=1872403 RepID=UPI003D9AF713